MLFKLWWLNFQKHVIQIVSQLSKTCYSNCSQMLPCPILGLKEMLGSFGRSSKESRAIVETVEENLRYRVSTWKQVPSSQENHSLCSQWNLPIECNLFFLVVQAMFLQLAVSVELYCCYLGLFLVVILVFVDIKCHIYHTHKKKDINSVSAQIITRKIYVFQDILFSFFSLKAHLIALIRHGIRLQILWEVVSSI